MSDDLVKRLRSGSYTKRGADDLIMDAADRISALEAALAKADELAGAWEKYQGLFHADDEDLVDAAASAYRQARDATT